MHNTDIPPVIQNRMQRTLDVFAQRMRITAVSVHAQSRVQNDWKLNNVSLAHQRPVFFTQVHNKRSTDEAQ